MTGTTPDGRLILVVYEPFDEMTVYPVTAFEWKSRGDHLRNRLNRGDVQNIS